MVCQFDKFVYLGPKLGIIGVFKSSVSAKPSGQLLAFRCFSGASLAQHPRYAFVRFMQRGPLVWYCSRRWGHAFHFASQIWVSGTVTTDYYGGF
jgi:hypothetical protein